MEAMKSLAVQVKNQLMLRYQEATNYLANFILPVPSNQVRLMIFGQGRTGSTLLESLLCSTGYFREHGELLDPAQGEVLYPIQYIRGLSKRKARENLIFHVKIYQLARDRKSPVDPAVFLETLYKKDGWKVIYLQRKNKVMHALSNLIAKHRGNYHKLSDDKEEFKIVVNCEKFVKRVNERFYFEKAEKKALANVEYHEVVYEEDLEKSDTHQNTVDRILTYLSLDNRKATTEYRKINTQSPKDLIVNYDEFVDCVVKQGWQEFLEY